MGVVASAVDFRILGSLEVLDGERRIAIVRPRQRALLALLLLDANQVVSADRLLEGLWGEQQPRSGLASVHVLVSELRKTLSVEDRLVTQAPGYLLRVDPDELDLQRFERLVADADGAEPSRAAAQLREALSLWRGVPLADFVYEPFAQAAIQRLEELKIIALQRRIEADLACGRDEHLVAELRQLVRLHQFREGLHGQLMLALYRSGRQAEALEAYQQARATLLDELGIEPSPALQELQQAILRQDPELELQPPAPPRRSILVVPRDTSGLEPLITLAEPLARTPRRDLMALLIVEPDHLQVATEGLSNLPVRGAAFTSTSPGRDIARLASEQDVDLIVLEGELTPDNEILLTSAPCDVALMPRVSEAPQLGPDRPVLVPFTGADHDWAAVELAAWIARAGEAPLQLAGRARDEKGHDASRLLASGALIVQRAAGIRTTPLLIEPGTDGLIAAAEAASLVVVGLPTDWRRKGLGETRAAIVAQAKPPTLIVHKGLRPSGLAPQGSLTRFSWTLRH